MDTDLRDLNSKIDDDDMISYKESPANAILNDPFPLIKHIN